MGDPVTTLSLTLAQDKAIQDQNVSYPTAAEGEVGFMDCKEHALIYQDESSQEQRVTCSLAAMSTCILTQVFSI